MNRRQGVLLLSVVVAASVVAGLFFAASHARPPDPEGRLIVAPERPCYDPWAKGLRALQARLGYKQARSDQALCRALALFQQLDPQSPLQRQISPRLLDEIILHSPFLDLYEFDGELLQGLAQELDLFWQDFTPGHGLSLALRDKPWQMSVVAHYFLWRRNGELTHLTTAQALLATRGGKTARHLWQSLEIKSAADSRQRLESLVSELEAAQLPPTLRDAYAGKRLQQLAAAQMALCRVAEIPFRCYQKAFAYYHLALRPLGANYIPGRRRDHPTAHLVVGASWLALKDFKAIKDNDPDLAARLLRSADPRSIYGFTGFASAHLPERAKTLVRQEVRALGRDFGFVR